MVQEKVSDYGEWLEKGITHRKGMARGKVSDYGEWLEKGIEHWSKMVRENVADYGRWLERSLEYPSKLARERSRVTHERSKRGLGHFDTAQEGSQMIER